jgi:hypothetical protein
MRGFGGFLVRFVLYAIGVGIAFVLASVEWSAFGLDAVASGGGPAAARIARWHDRLPVALSLATFLAAALGSVSRLLATFLFWALVAAIVSAPFLIARALG